MAILCAVITLGGITGGICRDDTPNRITDKSHFYLDTLLKDMLRRQKKFILIG